MIEVHRPDPRLAVATIAAVVALFASLDPDPTAVELLLLVGFAAFLGVLGRFTPPPWGGIIAIAIALAVTSSRYDATTSTAVPAAFAVGAVAAAVASSRTMAITGSLAVPFLLLVVGIQTGWDVPSGTLAVAVAIAVVGAVAFAADGQADRSALRRRALSAGLVVALVLPLAMAAAAVVPQTEQSGAGDRGAEPTEAPPASYVGFGDELDVTDPHDPSDSVVMRVEADQATYWRVQTFGRFDGERWTDTRAPVDPPVDPTVPRQELIQRFEVERRMVGFLPSAWLPTEVDAPVATRVRSDGTVEVGGALRPGTGFEVRGSRPLVDADGLRAATGVVPREIARAYLPEPVVSDRVRASAEEVTAGLTNDYDRIEALQDWIGDRVVYTRDIDPMPDGVDAVDHFLFETQRGFCEQVGTSLVVMAQSIGIPARLAVGYVPVERDAGEWVVRGRHAHAWVEVWFPGVGWQGFDPTAEVPLAADDTTEPAADSSTDWTAIAVLVIVVLLIAVVTALLLRRRRRSSVGATAERSPAEWASTASHTVVAAAGRAGVATSPPRTIREITADLVDRGADPDLGALVEVLDRAAFGGGTVSTHERERFEPLLRRLALWEPPAASAQDEQDSIEHPGRLRAHSGRLSE